MTVRGQFIDDWNPRGPGELNPEWEAAVDALLAETRGNLEDAAKAVVRAYFANPNVPVRLVEPILALQRLLRVADKNASEGEPR